jgi:L-lysine exporter family protein LysE/ArgO
MDVRPRHHAGQRRRFTTLGFGAGRLSRFFAQPRSWRILDATIAAIMIALAVSLLAGG